METKRLILRPIEVNDFHDICEYGCDEETGKYMLHWPKTQEQIMEFINMCVSSMNTEHVEWYEYVIQLKESNKVIGNISLVLKDTEIEIGWISNKSYWNKGYMSEAVNAIIIYAFSTFHISRIIATCTEKNIASYKVMEKCNMVRILVENNHKSQKNGHEVLYNKLTYCIEKPVY